MFQPSGSATVRRSATFNVALRKEKSLSASISYTTAPPRMFTSTKSAQAPKLELTQQPWYHEVDRKQSVELLKNGEDGSFLVRPSSQSQNALTLTLWYNGRIYNINVRHRTDGRYALGTEKPKEQSFTSIEELVYNYQSEKLVLYSGGEKTGRALLKSSPPKSQ
ncbi:hypothetical protein C0J52_23122 [Blattella germanica]|nr:hypothetical protein C0J52_23122 [Blattella germanica]